MFSPIDTIVAIATPSGRGGIGVVRVSGPRAADVARAILATAQPLEPRHATHTFVRRVATPGDLSGPALTRDSPAAPTIDEVVATFFPAPHSYTTEDVVEISAHGSPAVLREILRAAIDAGARLAEPGEFTFRAYLGGRIDLVQAEAVGDLVDAVTPLQARVAFDQLEGTLTRSIAALDAQLFDLVTKLEASIDFPDEGYHFVDPPTVAATLRDVVDGIERLIGGARLGRIIREGRQIAIVGKPNVGKSSLFNWLLGAERAIVTAIPGTTRDLLRETVDFDGVRLSLVDTAGIRDVHDEIEREGVARARHVHAVADLVFVMLDASRPLEADDEDVLTRTAPAPRLVIVNKIDLPRAWSSRGFDAASGRIQEPCRDAVSTEDVVRGGATPTEPPALARNESIARDEKTADAGRTTVGAGVGAEDVVEISLKTGAGLSWLREAIVRALELAESRGEEPLVTNIRHEVLLRDARESIDRALVGLSVGDVATQATGANPVEAESSAFARSCDGPPKPWRRRSDPAISEVRLNEELVLADLAAARRAFDEVVGRRTSEDILRAIFERFCIGK